MNVIVFGAFKGGVGRTTALVSIANYLARCGQHVVVMDMDVDAPSVPTLYGQSIWAADGAAWRGLVPWVMDAGRSSLETHMDSIYSSTGSLRILPAGPLGPQLLTAVLRSEWRELFERDYQTFWPFIHRYIERLEPTPDVVLIDARAGLGPVSGSLLTMKDATLAFVFSGDPDSLRVAKGLQERAEQDQQRLVPVLSRVPTFTTGGMRRVGEIVNAFSLNREKLVLIPAMPGREGRAEPSIGLVDDEQTEDSDASTEWLPQLAVDHVRLLRHLLPDFSVPDPVAEPRLIDLFTEATKVPRLDFKVFLNISTGKMVNPSDESRNVAFKVDTIRAVFEQIRRRMRESGMSDELLDKALIDGGRQAGDAFGAAITASLGDSSPAERLNAWCTFDTEVGFGHLQSAEVDRQAGWPEASDAYQVRITDPFLTITGGGGKVLEGYTIGVLCQILPTTADVLSNATPPVVLDENQRPAIGDVVAPLRPRVADSSPKTMIRWSSPLPAADVFWQSDTLVADVALPKSGPRNP